MNDDGEAVASWIIETDTVAHDYTLYAKHFNGTTWSTRNSFSSDSLTLRKK